MRAICLRESPPYFDSCYKSLRINTAAVEVQAGFTHWSAVSNFCGYCVELARCPHAWLIHLLIFLRGLRSGCVLYSGGTRFFFVFVGGGHWGDKMHIWGAKIADFCHFPFWRGGGQVGAEPLTGGQMPPHAPLVLPLVMLCTCFEQFFLPKSQVIKWYRIEFRLGLEVLMGQMWGFKGNALLFIRPDKFRSFHLYSQHYQKHSHFDQFRLPLIHSQVFMK